MVVLSLIWVAPMLKPIHNTAPLTPLSPPPDPREVRAGVQCQGAGRGEDNRPALLLPLAVRGPDEAAN